MNKPNYVAPKNLDEALAILGKQTAGVKIIAGGTDLIPRLRARMVAPSLLVDLRLLGLDGIEILGGRIRIGACTTHTGILESDLLAEHCPAIVKAARDVAGPPVRNRGTVGGNLVNASPAADLATPLLVHDAVAVVVKAGAEREVPLAEFFTGPGVTVLAPNELLKEIYVPTLADNTTSTFIKLGKRKAMAIAVVSAAARLTLDDGGKISHARIALGSVAPTPMRAVEAETLLQGKTPSVDLFAEAGHLTRSEVSPISDLRASGGYRKKMVAVLTRRALAAAWQQLGGE
jgi:carbon-monoxide dehydrogenase medium subunit|tara:strand:- start:5396 stop:6262 length:867 start_codon:yes stop_codon:yes gene_type:complete